MLSPLSNLGVSDSAAYLRCAIEVGLLDLDHAKEWAYGIVAELDIPPVEIIEVAGSNRRDDVVAKLSVVAKGANMPAAGIALLAQIGLELRAERRSLREALALAMRVSEVAKLPEDIYQAFNGLDDALWLAEAGTYGNTEDIKRDVEEEFNRYTVVK
ncbi:MAG: hypothetical protein KDA57_21675 [Planctomycetales bacterium]|nr:hypothetical protein [Planctomycetales bacterium]